MGAYAVIGRLILFPVLQIGTAHTNEHVDVGSTR
jgi:hypothetical protein